MPRIVSLQPDATSSVDLGHIVYQFDLGVTAWKNIPSFSLLYRYPFYTTPGIFRPADSAYISGGPSQMLLARVAVPIAEAPEALARVVEVSLDGGTEEADIARMTEAYQLFKNGTVRADRLEATIASSTLVLKGYWALRKWLSEGMVERREIDVEKTKLVCLP